MKVITLKRSGFSSNKGHIKGKNDEECLSLNWSVVVKLLGHC